MNIEQTLQQGIFAHNKGNLKKAERLYKAILRSQPKHPHANHNLGLLAFSFNNTVKAFTLFKKAIEANPKIEQFWLSYINALIKDQQFESARQVFKEAKKQDIDREKLNRLGVKLSLVAQKQNFSDLSPSQKQINSLTENYQKERFVDTERLAISITKEFPQHQYAWKILSIVLKRTGRLADSLAAMQTLIKLAPQDAEAHYNLGLTFYELGRLDEAKDSFNQAIALKSDYAQAYCDLGVILHNLKRLEEAEASYTKAIEIKTDYARAHNNLGIILQELGRFDESKNSLTKAKEFNPKFAETYFNLGFTLHKLKRLEEAITNYNQAIVLKPDYTQAYSNMGIIFHELGRYDKAETVYKQAITLKHDFAEAHFNMGVTLQELGRFDEAGTSYRQALTLKPNYMNAARNLVQLPLGQLDSNSLNLCEKVFDNPDNSLEYQIKYFFFHGNLLKHRGNIDQSFNAFCKANKLKSEVNKDKMTVEAKKNINSLTRIEKWVPCLPELDEKRITKLFIMGPSRSGKSSVERILSESSHVKALFETIRHKELTKNNHHNKASNELLFDNLFSQNERKLYNQGYKVITSTNPSNIFYSDYLMNMLPNSYLIIVKRDNRDVSPEIFISEYNKENLYSYDTKEIFKYLDVYNRICAALALKIPNRCLTVSFEDIIQAPEDVIERISRLAGINFRVKHLKRNISNFNYESLFRNQYSALINKSKC